MPEKKCLWKKEKDFWRKLKNNDLMKSKKKIIKDMRI
jgi:hypothetical protein